MAKVKIYMELLEVPDEKLANISELLKKRWTQYFLDNQGRVSQNEYAKHLGISGANLSNYILDLRKPEGQQVINLADALGPIVYDKLGLPRRMPRDPLLLEIIDNLDALTVDEQKDLLRKMKELKEKKEADHRALNRNAFA